MQRNIVCVGRLTDGMYAVDLKKVVNELALALLKKYVSILEV